MKTGKFEVGEPGERGSVSHELKEFHGLRVFEKVIGEYRLPLLASGRRLNFYADLDLAQTSTVALEGEEYLVQCLRRSKKHF